MMPSFNLIEEPFIPCVRMDGQYDVLGLKEVLLRAHEFAEVRDDSPLVTITLYRLLLAILHRCYQGPKNTTERMAIRNAGIFDPNRIKSYFEVWADRFDLFHEKYPFYQWSEFSIPEPSGVNRLAQELARGNNVTLFDHTVDNPPPAVTPAHAGRMIVAEQGFGIGLGKSPTGYLNNGPLVSSAIALVCGQSQMVSARRSTLAAWPRPPLPSS